MAATKKQLRERWQNGVGRAFLEKAHSSLFREIGHGHTIDEILPLLDGLPFRDEVPGGRDLRGLPGAFWREVNVAGFDFSYSSEIDLINCDASGAWFDEMQGKVTIGKMLTGASFKKARLRNCILQGDAAQRVSFEDAKVIACYFDDADLEGACFRGADCKGSVFIRANLVGCDFRGANLEEAVWLGVRLDKTTDLRGARLINLYNQDNFDKQGKLVNPGTDWRQATYDETTVSGTDPAAIAIETIDAALELLAERDDPDAKDLTARLTALKAKLPAQPDEIWLDHLLDELPPDRRDSTQTLIEEAMRNLL